jgi:hypothetical protein
VGSSSIASAGEEFPTSDTDLIHCTMAPATWRPNDVDAIVSCSAKVAIEVGAVEGVVADASNGGTTLSHTILQRDDAKLPRGGTQEFHVRITHGPVIGTHHREVRLEGLVRPEFDGKGDLGAFVDKLSADRSAHPLKYKIFVSRRSP